jgi:phage tail sheath gpL-like
MFTLMAVLRSLKTRITSKFPRAKLAADGTAFAPGSAIVTPSIIRAELISSVQGDGVRRPGAAQRPVRAEPDRGAQRLNPNRVDVLYPPTLVNQLRIFALLAQFRLQV